MEKVEELRALGKPGRLELAFIGIKTRDGYKRAAFAPPDGFRETSERRIVELIQTIRGEQFRPAADANCRWCSFKTICPTMPEGADA
jgi:hypothetical protein